MAPAGSRHTPEGKARVNSLSGRRSVRVTGLRLAVLVSLAVALVGCRQILGVEDHSEAATERDGSAPVSACGRWTYPATAEGDACRECIDARCCEAAKGCRGEPVCDAAFACRSACAPGDPTCDCYPSPNLVYSVDNWKLEACVVAECQAPCRRSCGWGPVDTACVERNCCTDGIAASRTKEMAEYVTCLFSVDILDAAGTCSAQYPEAAASGYKKCALEQCTSGRPGPADWSCLGKVEWPDNFGRTSIDFKVSFTDIVTGGALVDVPVTACLDDQCTPPLAAKRTLSDGSATLHLERPLFLGGRDFFTFVEVVDPVDAYPQLHYYFPPPIFSMTMGQVQAPKKSATEAELALLQPPILPDPQLGGIGLFALDCGGTPAAGVHLSMPDAPGARILYRSEQGTIDEGLTETSSHGLVGIANVPPGSHRLDASLADGTGRPVARVVLIVRAGAETVFGLRPTPNSYFTK